MLVAAGTEEASAEAGFGIAGGKAAESRADNGGGEDIDSGAGGVIAVSTVIGGDASATCSEACAGGAGRGYSFTVVLS